MDDGGGVTGAAATARRIAAALSLRIAERTAPKAFAATSPCQREQVGESDKNARQQRLDSAAAFAHDTSTDSDTAPPAPATATATAPSPSSFTCSSLSTAFSSGPRNSPDAALATAYVAMLPYAFTNNDVAQLFAPFGRLARVTVLRDRATRRSRGVAFVQFARVEDCARAVAVMHDKEVHGLRLACSLCRDNGRSHEFLRKRKHSQPPDRSTGTPASTAAASTALPRRCFECGEFGHLSYDCPLNVLGARERPAPAKKKLKKKKKRYDPHELVHYFDNEGVTDLLHGGIDKGYSYSLKMIYGKNLFKAVITIATLAAAAHANPAHGANKWSESGNDQGFGHGQQYRGIPRRNLDGKYSTASPRGPGAPCTNSKAEVQTVPATTPKAQAPAYPKGSNAGSKPSGGNDAGSKPGKGSNAGSKPGGGNDAGSKPGKGSNAGSKPSGGDDTGSKPGKGGNAGSKPGAWQGQQCWF
ncbi:hypothetical protein ATCC90586_001198 [Pythium insidiosum]|nr:hypothetical protein ATCC90586_001198 [Pythium insidiosum]